MARLSILVGRAGTGKTKKIMQEIKRRMAQGETGMLLIVPEQYSHDAERQLCYVCGDALSLHAEVLSFTRLCGLVFSETGGAAKQVLDKGSQILVMHKALSSTAPNLKAFGMRKTRTEMLENLLVAVRDFKNMCISTRDLEKIAQKTHSPLSEKLQDLAVIMSAYDALLEVYGGDLSERLTLLAEHIGESSVGSSGHIYFDGFNDFTAQELRIIEELLKKGADLTICLTCEPNDEEIIPGYAEVFEVPRRTIAQLRNMPAEIVITKAESKQDRAIELSHIEKYLFADKPEQFTIHNSQFIINNGTSGMPSPTTSELTGGLTEGRFSCQGLSRRCEDGAMKTSRPTHNSQLLTPNSTLHTLNSPLSTYNAPIAVYAAPTRYTECEYAAALIWDMVRSFDYRWRDIGVMARDVSQYESVCEHIFEKYGIPYFSSGKADTRSKPPIALIDAALDIATMGWEYKTLFRYLKTGLLPLEADEIAILENYVIKWSIRGSLWLREWVMPPSGYNTSHMSEKEKQADEKLLKSINALRERVTWPLVKLRDGIKGESDAGSKLLALYTFLTDISLPQKLSDKADELAEKDQIRLADEYTQLLGIIIDALDQMYAVLEDSKLSALEFRKLIALVLSQQEVGVIPISLDRVPLGSMAMSRRRDLKCLIILGATDDNIPRLEQGGGALSDNERMVLSKLDDRIPSGLEERLYREMNMIYSTITLPSEKLVLIYEEGSGKHPSFIARRICEMFGISESRLTEEQYLSAAKEPYMELLSRFENVQDTTQRAPLSRNTANLLYGSDISLSATRVNGFYSCKYRHFLQSGLRLKPRRLAQFDAASAGDFMHHVLDGVFSEIKASSGFKNVDDRELEELAAKYVDKYVKDVLLDFEGKDARFIYLFRAYEQSVMHVLRDMVDELKSSEFEPAEFEMDISELGAAHRGFVDRVDVFDSQDKVFLRVIDYKTRRKAYAFELGDVLHGRDMQMLIYLFTLEKHGRERFDKNVEPAGVLYIPARDVVISVPRNASDMEIEKLRTKEMRRSGLVLGDMQIIEAMESGADKKYLPVKVAKDGTFTGDSLVSPQQIWLLSRHVDGMMERAKREIQNGINECAPYYKSINDNACIYCEYSSVCKFDEEMGDRYRYMGRISTEEAWNQLTIDN